MLRTFFFAFAIALLSAANAAAIGVCNDCLGVNPADKNLCLYQSAICEATIFEEKDASDKLTPIQQFPVEVVAWTTFVAPPLGNAANGYVVGENKIGKAFNVFVSLAPEVQNLCEDYPKEKNELNLRLHQLLGLPPPPTLGENEGISRKFVTFRVKRKQKKRIVRPCIDPDVTTEGPCTFEESDSNDEPVLVPEKVRKRRHVIWLLSFAFNEAWKIPNGFPFTRLGYTYDWNPTTDRFGVSEYVLRGGARYEVVDITSTEDYCSVVVP